MLDVLQAFARDKYTYLRLDGTHVSHPPTHPPIVYSSPFEPPFSRLSSCAIGAVFARESLPPPPPPPPIEKAFLGGGGGRLELPPPKFSSHPPTHPPSPLGDTNSAERQGLIDEFTSDKSIQLFFISTKAGGLVSQPPPPPIHPPPTHTHTHTHPHPPTTGPEPDLRLQGGGKSCFLYIVLGFWDPCVCLSFFLLHATPVSQTQTTPHTYTAFHAQYKQIFDMNWNPTHDLQVRFNQSTVPPTFP